MRDRVCKDERQYNRAAAYIEYVVMLLPHPVRLPRPTSLPIRCSASTPPPENPWNFAYIHRERASLWTDDNKVLKKPKIKRLLFRHPSHQARLVKLITSNQLSIPVRDLEYRVFELTLLVPDLAKRLHTLQPTTLAALLTNTTEVATGLIALRQLLPTANVGALVARQPDILLQARVAGPALLCTQLSHTG